MALTDEDMGEDVVSIDPNIEPDKANAVRQMLEDRNIPVLETPPMTLDLLVGAYRNGSYEKSVVLRELDGLDEEYLAKFPFFKEPMKYLNALLERGVEEIGGEKPSKQELLGLLIGDRELIALHIRIVSVGQFVEMQLTCPECDSQNDITFDLLKDIEVRETKYSAVGNRISLPGGKQAVIRFPTGADQTAVLGDSKKKQTLPEMNSGMIALCLESLDDQTAITVGTAQRLKTKDRKEILTFITENQPGPQFGEGVKLPCANCTEEFTVRIDLADLFPI